MLFVRLDGSYATILRPFDFTLCRILGRFDLGILHILRQMYSTVKLAVFGSVNQTSFVLSSHEFLPNRFASGFLGEKLCMHKDVANSK